MAQRELQTLLLQDLAPEDGGPQFLPLCHSMRCIGVIDLSIQSQCQGSREGNLQCVWLLNVTCVMNSLPSNLSGILILYFLTSPQSSSIARQSSISGCQWKPTQPFFWHQHGLRGPSMTIGNRSCTRNADLLLPSLSCAVAPCFNGCRVCLDLLFGYTLLYLVFTRRLPFSQLRVCLLLLVDLCFIHTS